MRDEYEETGGNKLQHKKFEQNDDWKQQKQKCFIKGLEIQRYSKHKWTQEGLKMMAVRRKEPSEWIKIRKGPWIKYEKYWDREGPLAKSLDHLLPVR